MKKNEPWKVTDARQRRALKLVEAFQEWRSLADRNSFPRSLHDIAEQALVHEYALGRKAAKR